MLEFGVEHFGKYSRISEEIKYFFASREGLIKIC